jgi:hypothetical protein
VGANPVLFKDLANAFQNPEVGPGGNLQNCPGEKTEELAFVDTGLRCTSFDWISTRKASTTSPYAEHAPEAHLPKHLEESDSIHVVI